MTTKHRLESGRKAWQRYLAEFLGTFCLVFTGCGAVISNTQSNGAVTLTGIALAFGFVVAAMIYTLGPVSAAHFNPAVTLGFAVVRRFPWRHVPPYLIAQAAGATFASLMHQLLFGVELSAQANYGATSPNVPLGSAFGFEVVLTFVLMLVAMAIATDKRVSPVVPGLAVGMTVSLLVFCGATSTGASLNPARSLGPALFAGGTALSTLWLYLLAPTLGSILAAGCYEMLRDGGDHAQSAPADL